MKDAHFAAKRKAMLHAWAAAWYRRHDRELASEGVRFPLRVGRKTYLVTSEQALAAVSRTIQELDAALVQRSSWGCDQRGRPCDLAMRGLINRRLASRVLDQLRLKAPDPEERLWAPVRGDASDAPTLGDTISDPGSATSKETGVWLREVLSHEPRTTRELVVCHMAGESCNEISEGLGVTTAAARQRLSRFRRRHLPDLLDAA